MSHLIMHHEYRHLDDKSRALVSRNNAKCSDEAHKLLIGIMDCSSALEGYETDGQALVLLDKDYRKLRGIYRKLNRQFRRAYRKSRSKL